MATFKESYVKPRFKTDWVESKKQSGGRKYIDDEELDPQLEEDFETADLLNTSLENLKSQSQIVKIVSNKSNSLENI